MLDHLSATNAALRATTGTLRKSTLGEGHADTLTGETTTTHILLGLHGTALAEAATHRN
jgi:hypothetical protein